MTSNMVRMVVLLISGMSLKMGRVLFERRSPGQIFGKPCVHSRGHIVSPINFKLGQNVYLDNISDEIKSGTRRVRKPLTDSLKEFREKNMTAMVAAYSHCMT